MRTCRAQRSGVPSAKPYLSPCKPSSQRRRCNQSLTIYIRRCSACHQAESVHRPSHVDFFFVVNVLVVNIKYNLLNQLKLLSSHLPFVPTLTHLMCGCHLNREHHKLRVKIYVENHRKVVNICTPRERQPGRGSGMFNGKKLL